MELDAVTSNVLKAIDTNGFKQEGAYNLRYNGQALCHGDSEHIKIRRKEDKPGVDVYISGEAEGEQVHIPVVISRSGVTDVVYNDFYIEEGADVVIVAGCGIHNSGCNETRHDGIHAFHVGKNAKVVYEEKHYGEGEGTGENILNPVTQIYLGESRREKAGFLYLGYGADPGCGFYQAQDRCGHGAWQQADGDGKADDP